VRIQVERLRFCGQKLKGKVIAGDQSVLAAVREGWLRLAFGHRGRISHRDGFFDVQWALGGSRTVPIVDAVSDVRGLLDFVNQQARPQRVDGSRADKNAVAFGHRDAPQSWHLP